jgi:hypothetical protein
MWRKKQSASLPFLPRFPIIKIDYCNVFNIEFHMFSQLFIYLHAAIVVVPPAPPPPLSHSFAFRSSQLYKQKMQARNLQPISPKVRKKFQGEV